jgi:hypothetical protein
VRHGGLLLSADWGQMESIQGRVVYVFSTENSKKAGQKRENLPSLRNARDHSSQQAG